jgi:amino acid adenylation domain-containing protein
MRAPRVPHLVASVQQFAASQPKRAALTFLRPGGEDMSWTWEQVDLRARAVAVSLQRSKAPKRALILCPPGLDYVAAFLGCLYARWIAIPAYPVQDARSRLRVQHILRDATPSLALSASPWVQHQRDALPLELPWTAVDALPSEQADGWTEPSSSPDDVAFLQYTSGSTRAPRGVMVSHRNLLHNHLAMQRLFGTGQDTVSVSWLPPYHDMGLIGGILHLLFVGGHGWMLSPDAFLQDPLCWLEAISRTGATFSGGPDFGYSLCAAKADPDRVRAMDLRAWKTAVHGAEPVRPSTLRRFAEAFAPAGFDPRAHTPCYGLAEATLLVSGASGVHQVSFSAAALSHHRATPSDPSREETRAFVACGPSIEGQDILIVDPVTQAPCPPGHVGEILVCGPSVALGYWENPEESARAFHQRFSPANPPYLRTGDLGVVHDGQLYVTGRLKDLIIVRGQNIYPHDVEGAVEDRVPGVRRGGTVAFPAPAPDGTEGLVCVATPGSTGRNFAALLGQIRAAILEETRIEPLAVLLLSPGAVPKTSSGKLQRSACRDAFLGATWTPLARWDAPRGSDGETEPTDDPFPGTEHADEVERWLASRIATRAGTDVRSVAPDSSVTSLGLDSIGMVGLIHDLERTTGRKLELVDLLGGATVSNLAEALRTAAPNLTAVSESSAASEGRCPLSLPQQRLWFAHQSDPKGSALGLVTCVHARGPLDLESFRRAFEGVVRRHDVLRTTFAEHDEQVLPVVRAASRWPLTLEDFRGAQDTRERELERVVRLYASRDYDLEHGPLLLTHVLRFGPSDHVIVLAMHHIVADGWSMAVLATELMQQYRSLVGASGDDTSQLPDLPFQYADFARWQRSVLAAPTVQTHLAAWAERLEDAVPLVLPSDRQGPARGAAGRHSRFVLEAPLVRPLRALAQRHGATFFMALLTVFKAMLLRNTSQEDLCVGTVVANRERADLANLIGFFVNALPLRTVLHPKDTFAEALGKVRETCLHAFAHQAVDFEQIARLPSVAAIPGKPPLLNVLFVLQNAPRVPLALPGVGIHVLDVETGTAKADLAWEFTEVEDEVRIVAEYRTALFDDTTIGRLAGQFRLLVERWPHSAGVAIGDVDLMDEPSRRAIEPMMGVGVRRAPFVAAVDRVFGWAARTPEAIAVHDGSTTLSFRELATQARGLAAGLASIGVGTECVVGLLASRGTALPLGWLGILASKGAVLPLDATHPPARLQALLQDARVRHVLVEQRHASLLDPNLWEAISTVDPLGAEGTALGMYRSRGTASEASPLPMPIHPDQAAYVLYTSGSTGKPKGVVVTQGALSNLCDAQAKVFGLRPGDRVLQVAAPAFDASVSELFVTWSAGATVIMPPEGASDTDALESALVDANVTLATITPTVARLLSIRTGSLRTLVLAGEPADAGLVHRLGALCQVMNAYGPTEATVCATVCACDAAAEPAIGRPLPGVSVYVLDDALRLVPVGVAGEIFVGGAGVSRGYLGDPGRTARSFLPDPYASSPGARMYRTGDRGRWTADGQLVFLGRNDGQVKVRAVRVEVGEVEAALRTHPDVLDAVVRLDPRRQGAGLVAWVKLRETASAMSPAGFDATFSDSATPEGSASHARQLPAWRWRELRQHVQAVLPPAAVPSELRAVSSIPRTTSGKVDANRLLAEVGRSDDSDGFIAPRTPLEQAVADQVAALLGRDRVGATDDFFEIGGHSLTAAQLSSRLRRELGVGLSVRALLEDRTVEGIARRIAETSLAARGDSLPPLVPASRTGEMPLSHAQQRLWFLHQMDPTRASYNMPAALRLRGSLDVNVLRQAIDEVVARHEGLRTSFVARRGKPSQVIHTHGSWELGTVDLSSLDAEQQRLQLEARSMAEARRPFDLASPPPFRATLLRLGERDHVLLFTMHHIASDGWSAGVFHREVSELYGAFAAGQPSPLAPLRVQVADFAVWQRTWLAAPMLDAQLAYWRAQLDGAPALSLPTDRVRPLAPSFEGRHLSFDLDGQTTQALRALAATQDATLFMVLAAGFGLLLHRYSGQTDLCLGTPVANRVHPDLEPLIGFFVNSLVLRVDTSGDPPFTELLRRVRGTALDAYAHQDLPFERLVEALQLRRDGTRNPLFQVMLALQNAPSRPLRVAGLELEPVPVETGTSRFDLLLSLEEKPTGLRGILEYSSDLFDETTATRMTRHYRRLLESVAHDPRRPLSRYSLRNPEELTRIADAFRTSSSCPPPLHALDLFATQARKQPTGVALAASDRTLTYGELHGAARHLAHRLRSHGAGPDVTVGLLSRRSSALVVGILGVLLSGGAYVPLPDSYPPERLRHMVEAAGVRLLVADPSVRDRLPGFDGIVIELEDAFSSVDVPPAPPLLHTEQLAYVLFTSGSTGIPKPVGIPHRAVHAFLTWVLQAFTPSELACVLAGTSCAFDLSIFEILGTLSVGGTVALVQDVLGLHDCPVRDRVTLINTVPSAMRQLLRLGAVPPSVCTVNLAGEPLTMDLVRQLYALPGVRRVANLYGPTETTTYSTYANVGVDEPGVVPIGAPILGTRVYVLDASLSPTAVGEWGEIYIAGAGLGRGILHDPAGTARRFVPDPFCPTPGARMYRTGDGGRVLAGGHLAFAGRIDDQVKVRGVRIELQEVEAVLRQHPRVHDAAVIARDANQVAELAAYVVASAKDELPSDIEALAQEQVGHWRSVYDASHAEDGDRPPRFDTRGWTSSFTGKPYDPQSMRAWVDGIVSRLRGLAPCRVLEIGCGTGLVLFGLVDLCVSYDATDFSQPVLDRVRQALSPLESGKVRLLHREAADLSGLQDHYDLVVINSVVQYLPNAERAAALLDAAADRVAPGGHLFVGDVRNLALLPMFHAAVQLCQAPPERPLSELAARASRAMRAEVELALDPRFFELWCARNPGFGPPRLLGRTAREPTEMNLYRYDVILPRGEHCDKVTPAELPWPNDSPGTGLLRELPTSPVVLRQVPDDRIASHARLLSWTDQPGAADTPSNALAARQSLETVRSGVNLEELLASLRSGGCEAEVLPASSDATCDVVVWPAGGPRPLCEARSVRTACVANDPLLPRREARLVASLRRHLESRLPEAMIPSHFALLDALPRTPSGKVDRIALRVAEVPATSSTHYVAPSSPLEKLLASMFEDLLRVDRVGVHDDFFEMGGHSLLATQLVSRIREELDVSVPLRLVFEHTTVAALALALAQDLAAGVTGGDLTDDDFEEGEL